MEISKEVEAILNKMALYAQKKHHEYVTPEHLLYVLTEEGLFARSFRLCGGNLSLLKANLEIYMKDNLEQVEDKIEKLQLSSGLNQILIEAEGKAISCEKYVVELSHLVSGIMNLKESHAAYYMKAQGIEAAQLLSEMNSLELEKEEEEEIREEEQDRENKAQEHKEILKRYAVLLNEEAVKGNPLIGREEELSRTIQVLCRRGKNNPLHIGEPGVGKTAITYGLAARINAGRVPDRLRGAKVYAIDIGSMLAGAQYRGDFEKRFKQLMDAVAKEEKPILYFDEIHTLVGAGAVNGGSLDASNMLKPYLSEGEIRFIGATTYEEYKKYFSKSKSLVRRFQNIDIKEPSVEETIVILNGLKKYYEDFHKVRYGKGCLEHAAELSSQFINERFLPDKAIDLLDEAGAYRVMNPTDKKIQMVDKALIEEVLSKTMNIPKQTLETDEMKKLSRLEKEMEEQIFGQKEAISQLVNVVKFGKAGLNEENKPIGSLLFAGPTGVGKTESAKCLAKLLGVKLIRFDMSEYAEKHSVAKLIGSPAGYVGYEEGGILTEAVRKHPHCVLLLDEIEKAHGDIYNVLLQVMDYATLTDNQGRKADFRNVILIMTSNAGAKNIGKPKIGFGEGEMGSEAVMEEVKKVFNPEFRNRLDRIVTFCGLDQDMALRIVKKQLGLLADKLKQKGVELDTSPGLRKYLREKGTSREYGAREIGRIIHTELKPLLVDEILFGRLKKGGTCMVDYKKNSMLLTIDGKK